MKRKLAVLLAAVMLLCCFTGCSLGTQSYSCKDLTMNVPFGMRDVTGQESWSAYTFTLDSSKVAIFGLYEDASLFGAEVTLSDYADLVLEANDIDALAIKRSGHNYYYFTFDKALEDGNYRYLAGLYEGKDGFWMVQIASKITNYDETAFFEYLDSVTLS